MGSHPEVGLGDRWTGHSHTVSHSVTQCHTVIGVTGVHITETGARVWNRPKAAPVPTVTMTSFNVILFFLVVSSHARPQVSTHPVPPSDRARVLTDFVPAPDCDSVFRRSLPECQQQSTGYGNFGDVWGELTVDVSSPVLFISQPKDLIEKRKQKKEEEEQSSISV